METRLTFKLVRFAQALADWERSLEIDTTGLSAVVEDTVRSGQVQKFEFVIEAFWKTVKVFLDEQHGFDDLSPKAVLKRYYLLGYVDAPAYEILMNCVNDRNRLSHIYSEDEFLSIHRQLPLYFATIREASQRLRPD